MSAASSDGSGAPCTASVDVAPSVPVCTDAAVETVDVSGPPGRETYCKLTYGVLDATALCALVTVAETGASSLFVGTTRDNFEGKVVVRLEYECYAAMALKEMKRLCEAVRESVPGLARIAVFHRLGVVPVREASVVIAVSSPHRKASLAALGELIDTLKARVPIWKQEVYADESSGWKANAEAGQGVSPATRE